MRFSRADVDLLCDQFLASGKLKDAPCPGCKLSEQLEKPPAARSKTFIARMEARVKKLRKNA